MVNKLKSVLKKTAPIALATAILTGCNGTNKDVNDTLDNNGSSVTNPDGNLKNGGVIVKAPIEIEVTKNNEVSIEEGKEGKIDLKNYIKIPKGMINTDIVIDDSKIKGFIDKNLVLHLDPISTDEKNIVLDLKISISGDNGEETGPTKQTFVGSLNLEVTVVDENNDSPVNVIYDKNFKNYLSENSEPQRYTFTISDEDGVSESDLPNILKVKNSKNWENVGELNYKVIKLTDKEIVIETYLDPSKFGVGNYVIGSDNFKGIVKGENKKSEKACYTGKITIIADTFPENLDIKNKKNLNPGENVKLIAKNSIVSGPTELTTTLGQFEVNGELVGNKYTFYPGQEVIIVAQASNSFGKELYGTIKSNGVEVDTFKLITKNNQAPIAEAGKDVTITEGQSVTLSGANSYDKDGKIVEYDWYDSNWNYIGNGKNLTKTGLSVGSHKFHLVVIDDLGLKSDLDEVIVKVKEKPVEKKDAPTSISVSTSNLDYNSAIINFSGSDLDGFDINFVKVGDQFFTDIDRNSGNVFVSGLNEKTRYKVIVNYSSKNGKTGKVESKNEVIYFTTKEAPVVNNKPTVTNGYSQINENTSVEINFTGADVDGDNLTYRVISGPSHGTFENGIYTPENNYVGADIIRFVANDGKVDSDIGTYRIDIKNVNEAPLLDIQASEKDGFTIDYSDPYNELADYTIDMSRTLVLDMSGSTDDGEIVSYKIVSDIRGELYNGNNSIVNIEPTYNQDRETLTITVTDDEGKSTIITKVISRY